MYVVVTGPPASGKSTLAPVLAAELGWPLLAKDTIKAGLVESLGAESIDESRRLGAAAVRALLALAHDNDDAVLDSVWVDRERAIAELAALPGQVVEVFCRCERGVLEERYAARGRGLDRPADDLWHEGSLRPLGGPWPVVEVKTDGPVERFGVLERLLVDGDAAAKGTSHSPRPLDPIDLQGDAVMLAAVASSWVRTLRRGGHTPQPFGIVLTLQGVPEMVAPVNWLSGPADWTMSWGEGEPDELAWVRDALDTTAVRHRAAAIVTVDGDVLRLQVRHRADDSVETLEVAL
ncbi:AAA family ATPase [Nocardioides conyzicola]|uniref:AAA family ATPase n=1 Tax=Nocardioides conyzicola TaxID=1651781 RepID=A0ABP8Y3E8_9ACTN